MIPVAPREFVRELKEISDNLDIQWEVGLERWVIYYNAPGYPPSRVHEIKEPDGSYRAPDKRVLDMLRRCDMSRYIDSPVYQFDKQLAQMKKYKAEQRKKNVEEHAYKLRQNASKVKKACENALNGIWNPSQLYQPKIFSLPSASVTLLKKLGRPAHYKSAGILNPK